MLLFRFDQLSSILRSKGVDSFIGSHQDFEDGAIFYRQPMEIV